MPRVTSVGLTKPTFERLAVVSKYWKMPGLVQNCVIRWKLHGNPPNASGVDGDVVRVLKVCLDDKIYLEAKKCRAIYSDDSKKFNLSRSFRYEVYLSYGQLKNHLETCMVDSTITDTAMAVKVRFRKDL